MLRYSIKTITIYTKCDKTVYLGILTGPLFCKNVGQQEKIWANATSALDHRCHHLSNHFGTISINQSQISGIDLKIHVRAIVRYCHLTSAALGVGNWFIVFARLDDWFAEPTND